MHTWAIDSYGGPERMQIRELPIPKKGSRDVLIEMQGGEIGDWDILVREGVWPMDRPFPLVLGLAGSGVVAEIGAHVTKFDVGDQVYVYTYPMHENGAWAEYMLVPESYVASAPTSLDLTRAGGVPIAGITAHETLNDVLGVQPREVVLITAAAGGVGHLAVQIAKQMNAEVVATTSSRHTEFVKELGADVVIDYTKEDFVEAVRRMYPRGVDKALNGVSGETANLVARTVRDGCKMVDLTQTATVHRSEIEIDTEYVVENDADRLGRLARMFDEGHLRLEVQEIFPFERACEALEVSRDKHVRGKLVLQIKP